MSGREVVESVAHSKEHGLLHVKCLQTSNKELKCNSHRIEDVSRGWRGAIVVILSHHSTFHFVLGWL